MKQEKKGRFTDLVEAVAQKAPIEERDTETVARGAPIEERDIEAVAEVLRGVLRGRGLFQGHPDMLGYPELRWSKKDDLRSIAIDAIEWAVAGRKRSLFARVRKGENIDGHVISNIKHFVTERQKKSDPMGWALYENVRGAFKELLVEEEVVQDEPGRKIDADTVVRPKTSIVDPGRKIDGDPVVRPKTSSVDSEATDELRRFLVERPLWNDLMAHACRVSKEGRDTVRQALRELFEENFAAVRVRDFVRAIRDDVRAAWRMKFFGNEDGLGWESNADEEAIPVPVVQPNEVPGDDWRRWVATIETAIKGEPIQDRRKEGVLAVFREYGHALENGDALPTQSEIGRRLNLKRSTLAEHVSLLRRIIKRIDPDL